jgi:hypothetical protein
MGVTPWQGIPFADADDPPCDIPAVIEAEAEAANRKGAGYDASVAAVKAPAFVKVSATNIPPRTDFAGPSITAFTNVDVNRGTPTDLSIFAAGLMLDPGVWMTGFRVVYAGRYPPGVYLHEVDYGGYQVGAASIPSMIVRNRDAGLSLPNPGPNGWPTQGNCSATTVFVTQAAQKIPASWDNWPVAINLASFWAWKIGEL